MPAQTHTCTYTHTASLCVKQQECISEPHIKSAAGHFFSLAEIMQLPLQHLDVSGRSCQLMWNCETFLELTALRIWALWQQLLWFWMHVTSLPLTLTAEYLKYTTHYSYRSSSPMWKPIPRSQQCTDLVLMLMRQEVWSSAVIHGWVAMVSVSLTADCDLRWKTFHQLTCCSGGILLQDHTCNDKADCMERCLILHTVTEKKTAHCDDLGHLFLALN